MSDFLPDEQQLADAEARMTSGPWEPAHVSSDLVGIQCSYKCLFDGHQETTMADAVGICLLRNGIRPLLERVRRMRGALRRIADLQPEGHSAGAIARGALAEEKP